MLNVPVAMIGFVLPRPVNIPEVVPPLTFRPTLVTVPPPAQPEHPPAPTMMPNTLREPLVVIVTLVLQIFSVPPVAEAERLQAPLVAPFNWRMPWTPGDPPKPRASVDVEAADCHPFNVA